LRAFYVKAIADRIRLPFRFGSEWWGSILVSKDLARLCYRTLRAGLAETKPV
jgi:hypothetical protein